MSRLGSRRRRLVAGAALLGAAVAVLVAAWASGLLFPDTARPAPAGSALARFRASDPRPQGIDGVYTYRTTGGESLDVLGGASHRYPAETTITVVETRAACGSAGTRSRAARRRGRSARAPAGSSCGGWTRRTAFFGHADRTQYACTQAGERFACRAAHGTETGQAAVVGEAGVEVGGVRVRALHVRMTARVGGGSSGTETAEWWLQPGTGLPLELVVTSRTSRAEPVVGQVHYRENATLRLVSTTPQR